MGTFRHPGAKILCALFKKDSIRIKLGQQETVSRHRWAVVTGEGRANPVVEFFSGFLSVSVCSGYVSSSRCEICVCFLKRILVKNKKRERKKEGDGGGRGGGGGGGGDGSLAAEIITVFVYTRDGDTVKE